MQEPSPKLPQRMGKWKGHPKGQDDLLRALHGAGAPAFLPLCSCWMGTALCPPTLLAPSERLPCAGGLLHAALPRGARCGAE